ncbi:MAG: TonB-dependent receptor plug domain-containing protein [Chitinophagales bacterium]
MVSDPVLRGFKYDQLNIVMDGVQSATAACPNSRIPPTSQMAPNMLDRIEILKGPHALRYGSGFGGTINFISNPNVSLNAHLCTGEFLPDMKPTVMYLEKKALSALAELATMSDYMALVTKRL